MDVAFTGYRFGIQSGPLVELLISEVKLPAEKARETVERILAIPVEKVELPDPEKAVKVAVGANKLGVPCHVNGRDVTFTGWRLGLGERRFVELLEAVGDVPPPLARATAHRLAEGPMVIVECENSVSAGDLIDTATPLGAVCKLAEASMWDME